MKLKQKLIVALFAAASVCGLSSAAFAGEGGAAGAAAFTLDDTGAVTGVAVAASIGKTDAAAAAFNSVGSVGAGEITNFAYALGSAGVITLTSIGDPANAGIASSTPNYTDDQVNEFNAALEINLGTVDGSNIVTIEPSL